MRYFTIKIIMVVILFPYSFQLRCSQRVVEKHGESLAIPGAIGFGIGVVGYLVWQRYFSGNADFYGVTRSGKGEDTYKAHLDRAKGSDSSIGSGSGASGSGSSDSPNCTPLSGSPLGSPNRRVADTARRRREEAARKLQEKEKLEEDEALELVLAPDGSMSPKSRLLRRLYKQLDSQDQELQCVIISNERYRATLELARAQGFKFDSPKSTSTTPQTSLTRRNAIRKLSPLFLTNDGQGAMLRRLSTGSSSAAAGASTASQTDSPSKTNGQLYFVDPNAITLTPVGSDKRGSLPGAQAPAAAGVARSLGRTDSTIIGSNNGALLPPPVPGAKAKSYDAGAGAADATGAALSPQRAGIPPLHNGARAVVAAPPALAASRYAYPPQLNQGIRQRSPTAGSPTRL